MLVLVELQGIGLRKILVYIQF